mgnify:CR=1 FL=1
MPTNNLIGGKASFALGLVLKENTRLKVLKLAMNRIDDQNGARIIKMIAKNNYLEELDLSTNEIGPEFVESSKESLKFNNTLKQLNISYTNVEIDKEIIKIAEAHPNLVIMAVRHSKTPEALFLQLESILTKKKIQLEYGSKFR